MRIYECWFCGGPVYPGHGLMFVRNDAKIFRFCRSKCHSNFKLKRNPRKVKWTKAWRKVHGKEMLVDSSLEFVKKRNRPGRYNRLQMQATLRAMKRIAEIRERRKLRFYENRMKDKKKQQVVAARREIDRDINLIQAPESLRNKKSMEMMVTDGPKNVEKEASFSMGVKGGKKKKADTMDY